MRVGQTNGLAVTTGQSFRFAVLTVLIDRADRVDHVPGCQLPTGCDDGLAGKQPSNLADDLPAFSQDSRPSRIMNGTIDATSAQKRRIGGIDDRVSGLGGDVGWAVDFEGPAIA